MIDIEALQVAIRSRLTGDATLAAMIEGVFAGYNPSSVTWAKPVIDIGWQANDRDQASSYGRPGHDLRLRVMVNDRGPAPGVGSMADVYAVLKRVDTVLLASPIVVSGQNVWGMNFLSGIHQDPTADSAGYLGLSVGAIYQVHSYE